MCFDVTSWDSPFLWPGLSWFLFLFSWCSHLYTLYSQDLVSCNGNHFCFAFDFGMSWVRWLWRLILEKLSTASMNSVFAACPGDLSVQALGPRTLMHYLVYNKSFSQVPHSPPVVLLYSRRKMGICLCGRWEGRFATMQISIAEAPLRGVASWLFYTAVCSAIFQALPCALWKELLGQQLFPLLTVFVIILNEVGDIWLC